MITNVIQQDRSIVLSWVEGDYVTLPTSGTTTIPGTFDTFNMPIENLEEALHVWDVWCLEQA